MYATTERLPFLHPSPFHGQEKKRGRKKRSRLLSVESSGSMDGSLTSLSWLHDFKIPDISSQELSQVQPLSPKAMGNDDVFATSIESDKEPEKEEFFISISPLRRCLLQSAEFYRDPNKYREDPYKPPLSYTTLIFLAIQASKKDKVMLSEIYQWIRDHFLYYRLAEPTWQNSVRHNLSLNEFFTKVPRTEGSAGKGSFWKVNPEYEHFLNQDGELQRLTECQIRQQAMRSKTKSRKRAQSQNGSSKKEMATSRKRSKSISVTIPADPCHLPGDLDWVSLLSSQKVVTCSSCTDGHNCRPTFGSPVLGPPDLGHIGDPIICSPAVIPSTLISRVPDTPPIVSQPVILHPPFISIEETMISSHDSPSPLLPRWAESRSQSPNMALEHPWADTKDGLLRSACNMDSLTQVWSSDVGWISLPQSGYPCKSNSKMSVAQNM